MSILAFVLSIIALDSVLGLVAEWLNLRNFASEPPAEFRDVYDNERYRKAKAYQSENFRFGILRTAFSLAVLVAWSVAGGFPWLDEKVRALSLGPVLTGSAFIGALSLGRFLLSLPFSIY